MKRFSPYKEYKINGETRYSFTAPNGEKKISAAWLDDRIEDIRHIFLGSEKNPKFKEHQLEVIESILAGNDTFAILPTGAGKSLCFQAPSVFFPGITLVITPLAALIQDQAGNFNNRLYSLRHTGPCSSYHADIRFKAIYPGMDNLSLQEMFSEMRYPRENSNNGSEVQYKLLYVSPERLCHPKFLREFYDAEKNGLRIDHIVIDEVHCLSQWGFEFRESYLHVRNFIMHRPVRPMISAFTATAAPKDIMEIKNILDLPMDGQVIFGKPNAYPNRKYMEIFHVNRRENLSLEVRRCSDYDAGKKNNSKSARRKTRLDELIGLLGENITRVCIIYRTTAAGVDELYDILKDHEFLKGRLVKYHSQLNDREKNRNLNLFLNSNDHGMLPDDPERSGNNIMIATKAFGMGIDKDDVSVVIHYDTPRSLEDYYQEAGRAGRDADKVPKAECYILYSAGPKNEKGTLQNTIDWVTSERDSPGSGCMPIASQFSENMKEGIYFWSYYRLCYVMKYCNAIDKDPDKAHDFMIDYLQNRFSGNQIKSDFDLFYKYIVENYPVPGDERERFIDQCLFQGADAERFLGPDPGQTKQGSGGCHSEIRQIINEVNELHINNTYLANQLRDHPDRYQLNRRENLSMSEWKSEMNKTVNGEDSLTFTIHGSEKLSYFDMCVLDAVYSIEISQKETIYVQTIWEILTGRNPEYSSQEKLCFRTNIQNSIDKMRTMSISLSDSQYNLKIEDEVFLPLIDKPKGQKGYSYSDIPPLFRYAEKMNGQIIRVPVSLLNVAKIRKSVLWKEDFSTEFLLDRLDGYPLSGNNEHAFSETVKKMPQSKEFEEKINKLIGSKEYSRLESIRKRKYSFSPSMDNALLCHYLLRRISISRRTRRGDHILASTIKSVTKIVEDSCLFNKKVMAIMDHYQNIGYINDYYAYIRDHKYQLTNGKEITDTAYFQVEAADTIKYWRLYDTGHLLLSDFTMTWFSQYNERLVEGCDLSADTINKLAVVPLSRMDGVVLKH